MKAPWEKDGAALSRSRHSAHAHAHARDRDTALDYGYCAVGAQRWEKRRQLTSRGGFLSVKTRPRPLTGSRERRGRGEGFDATRVTIRR